MSENLAVNKVFERVLGGKSPYPHQLETAKNLLKNKSVILRAPCGSGKTEACYVSLLLRRNSSLPSRLIYSLPTRALVEDVVSRIKEGINKIELSLTVSPQHGANSKDPFLKSDVVVATIDQTVGAYCCTPLSLPVYLGNIPAGAAVSSFLCFDEAHVYDHLLGLQSMLVLVERSVKLELPFVVMSATLPDSFIGWFKGNERFADKIAIVEGKDEDIPKRRDRRVILKWMDKLLEENDVLKSADSWRRIMVVCNTVGRAQKLYESVKRRLDDCGFNVFLLHSRFLGKDRKEIEQKMKVCLKDSEKKTCLITTQVCEVGLDISCDLLLSELAPPDALIQRMGRCAREGGKGEVWVFDVEFSAPYSHSDMEKSRRYLREKLDGKRIGWNEELEFVNALLKEEFGQIMKDESCRRKILLSLGDAAFKGSKREIESNIREILSVNLTIHDDPCQLNYWEMRYMPWINIDVRVLRKHLNKAKIWEINFGHDENGKPDFNVTIARELHPYGYYVIHPSCAKYDSDAGLILGEEGENLRTSELPLEPKPRFEYQKETWEEHVENCLNAFEHIKKSELYTLRLLAKILNYDLCKTEGLVALSLAVHDLGKLNEKWQKEIGVEISDIPLAHIPLSRKIKVPHATVSAQASYPMFKRLIDRKYYALAFKFAIAHHHHTRAEQVNPYVLRWQDIYEKLIMKICEKYSLNADIHDIRKIEEFPKVMETSIFDIESIRPYTAYCIIARFIRLSDRSSFNNV